MSARTAALVLIILALVAGLAGVLVAMAGSVTTGFVLDGVAVASLAGAALLSKRA